MHQPNVGVVRQNQAKTMKHGIASFLETKEPINVKI